MHQRSPRRLMVVPAALLALVITAGVPASASRSRAGDAFARAVALQVNALATVTAQARGDQATTASGATLVVPQTLEVRSAQSAAQTRVHGGLHSRAESSLGELQLQAARAHLSISLTAMRTECDLAPRAAVARTQLVVHQATATLLGLHGEVDGDGDHVLIDVSPNTEVDLGGGVTVVLNEQRHAGRPGRDVTVNGAVLRVGGLAVVTLASSHCQLRGDVGSHGGGNSSLVVAPSVGIEGPDTELQAVVGADALVEADASVAVRTSVARRPQGGSWLASIEAEAYVRAASHR